MKTVSFKTVGCRLNQAETTELSAMFGEAGFKVLPYGTPTDAVIIHTCAVTARAEKDCIRTARSCARMEHKPFVVLAGCAAEVSADTLESECAPDLIVGQDDKFKLPQTLAEILNVTRVDNETVEPASTRTRAIVKVQSGCDFHCTYCIVPAARGRPTSLTADEILRHVRELAGQGYKEVILTGANLGCYGTSAGDLVDLLERVEQEDGIERIRLSSIEITTAERRLVDYMRSSEKVCRHLHVPLQSGNDNVLGCMNRKYTSSDYREFCEYALDQLPDLALGTDVIVGFPAETNEEHQDTVDLITAIPFSNLHVFQYSKRTGTPAAEMTPQVSSRVKKARSEELLELGRSKRAAFAESLTGRKCSVLIEKIDDDGKACGWTREYIRAEISTFTPKINEIVSFTPIRASDGVICDS